MGNNTGTRSQKVDKDPEHDSRRVKFILWVMRCLQQDAHWKRNANKRKGKCLSVAAALWFTIDGTEAVGSTVLQVP